MDLVLDALSAYHGFDIAGFALTLWSLVLLGSHKRSGFLVGAVAALAWIGFAAHAGSWPTIVANLVFAGLNLRGWVNWKHQVPAAPTPTGEPA